MILRFGYDFVLQQAISASLPVFNFIEADWQDDNDSFCIWFSGDGQRLSPLTENQFQKKMRTIVQQALKLNHLMMLKQIDFSNTSLRDKLPIVCNVVRHIRMTDKVEYLELRLLQPSGLIFDDSNTDTVNYAFQFTKVAKYLVYYDAKLSYFVPKSEITFSRLIPTPISDQYLTKLLTVFGLDRVLCNAFPIFNDVYRFCSEKYPVPLSFEYVLKFSNLHAMWCDKFHTTTVGRRVNRQYLSDTYVLGRLVKYVTPTYYSWLVNQVLASSAPYFTTDAVWHSNLRIGCKTWLMRMLAETEANRFRLTASFKNRSDLVSLLLSIFSLADDLKMPWCLTGYSIAGLIRQRKRLRQQQLVKLAARRSLLLPQWSRRLSAALPMMLPGVTSIVTSLELYQEDEQWHTLGAVQHFITAINTHQAAVFHYDIDGTFGTFFVINNGTKTAPTYQFVRFLSAPFVTSDWLVTAIDKIKRTLAVLNS